MKFLITKISIITQLHEESLFEIEDEKEDFEDIKDFYIELENHMKVVFKNVVLQRNDLSCIEVLK